MIDKERVEENKQLYISLLMSIKRDNARLNKLVEFLEKSDFFVAPASTKYHGSYEGGLCEHSLNVYLNLVLLNSIKRTKLSDDTMKILALCHDFGKIGQYEQYVHNKKVYQEDGSQSDSAGKYDWVSVTSYKRREKKFVVLGSHGEMSEYITRCYIPLNMAETAAILNHHSGFDAPPSTNISEIYATYPESLLLHLADCLSSHYDEIV